MKKIIFFVIALILFLLFMKTVTPIQINEIMYNPTGDDNNLEFVEIYSEDNVSLDGWVISDLESNDTLNEIYFCNCSYSLIVEDDFNFDYYNISENTPSIYKIGATIGNNLDNTKETLSIFKPVDIGEEIIFVLMNEISYNSSIGGNGNDYSLEFFNKTWYESLIVLGTPGNTNSWFFVPTNQTTNETIEDNETNTTECEFDVSIEISTEPIIENGVEAYLNEEKLNYKIDVDGINEFEMTYWIEEFNGENLKSKVTSTNDNSRSWTINIDKEYLVAIIKAEVIPICSQNKKNISSFFVAKNQGWAGEEESIEEDETIEKSEIELVKYDAKTKENAPFLIEFIARKGDTRKTKLDFWIEKENKYSIYLYDKNSEQKFKIPMVVGCVNKSDLNLYFEGVEINQSFKLNMSVECLDEKECEICEECSYSENDCISSDNPDDSVFILTNQTLNQTFESSSSKAKQFIPYILGISSLVALVGALII